MFSNCEFDKSKNKVYINPNFSGPPIHSYPMHVNPKFSYRLPNVQPNLNNKPRIHINPNFMKSKSADEVARVNRTCTNVSNRSNHMSEVPVAKSRYCLVRQNANNLLKEPILYKPKTTIQINKYKSVPLCDIKTKLDNAKNALLKQSNHHQSNNKKHLNPSTTSKRNQFKLVNNKGAIVCSVKNVKIKTHHTTVTINGVHKNVLLNQSKLNKVKVKSLRKNNIPCPKFRKFGKCLRKEHGNCEFLHDRKHVSICRKFIKGLCYDKACLLSHDLTMKKMPTCYFYLQGTCTKPDCPYLHVKLNEKVEVCADFLKGYCERGSKCLQRHSNIQTAKKYKNTSVARSTSQKKNSKLKIRRTNSKDSKATITSIENRSLTERNDNNSDRYYQDNTAGVSSTDICEVIKPLRCKLGTLPSFIQL